MSYDVFISYASEDRAAVALPLADRLKSLGLNVWFDQTSLAIGDNIRSSIDLGLSQSRFGVVIFSKYFFAKEWPQQELEGLFSRDLLGSKVILPVWHQVTKKDVIDFSPMLANRLSANTQAGIPAVAEMLVAAMSEADKGGNSSAGIEIAFGKINKLPPCPECEVRVSTTAETCPSCGYRLKGRKNLVYCSNCEMEVIGKAHPTEWVRKQCPHCGKTVNLPAVGCFLLIFGLVAIAFTSLILG